MILRSLEIKLMKLLGNFLFFPNFHYSSFRFWFSYHGCWFIYGCVPRWGQPAFLLLLWFLLIWVRWHTVRVTTLIRMRVLQVLLFPLLRPYLKGGRGRVFQLSYCPLSPTNLLNRGSGAQLLLRQNRKLPQHVWKL